MASIIDVAIKLLSDHNCSEQDLKRRLEKEFAELPEIDKRIESALARLRALHLINDNRLANSLAERYSHKGNRFIFQILRQKGVRDEVIAETLALLDDEYARALDEARKKAARRQDESPEKLQNRVYRFLSGRGFSYETIDAVVKQLTDERVLVACDYEL